MASLDNYLDSISSAVDRVVTPKVRHTALRSRSPHEDGAGEEPGGEGDGEGAATEQPTPSNPLRDLELAVGQIQALVNLPAELLNITVAYLAGPLSEAYGEVAAKVAAALGIQLGAATQTSLFVGPPHAHAHPPSNGIIALPSFGMVLFGCTPRVLIGGKPAARAGDIGLAPTCCGFTPFFEILTGSATVFIGGSRAARVLDFAFICKPPAAKPTAPSLSLLKGVAMDALSLGAGLIDAAHSADAAEANPDDTTAQAEAQAAQVEVASAAAELAAGTAAAAVQAVVQALRVLLGKDPGIMGSIPPLTPGMPNVPGILVKGEPTVLIGGLPLPNDLMGLLCGAIGKLRRRRSKNGGCGKVGEPVEVVTGANIDVFVDYESPTGDGFFFRRTYDSVRHVRPGALGIGFRHGFEQELSYGIDGLVFVDELGERGTFPQPSEGGSVLLDGMRLVRIAPRQYRVDTPAGVMYDFLFDANDRPARLIRVRFDVDHGFELSYDERGRLTEITGGRAVRAQYFLSWTDDARIVGLYCTDERATLHSPPQPLIVYRYDARGQLIAVSDAAGREQHFAFDDQGRMTRKTDARGFSFTYAYDSQGRCVEFGSDDGLHAGRLVFEPGVTTHTAADGGVWSYRYDPNGTITAITDPYGYTRTREIDADGRLSAESDATGATECWLYDASDVPIGRLLPDGTFAPPVDEEPGIESAPPSRCAAWEHGLRLARVIRPSRDPARCKLDHAGRLICYHGRSSPLEEWSYDACNNVLSHHNRDGITERFTYYSWNLPRTHTDGLGQHTQYGHNRMGLLTAVRDPGGTVTEYRHDLCARLTEVWRGDTCKEQYVYTAADVLIEKRDGDGQTLLRYAVDDAGRVTACHLADGESQCFDLDGLGRIVTASVGDSKVELSYDAAGRPCCDLRNGAGTRWLPVLQAEGDATHAVAVLDNFVTRYRNARCGLLTIEDPTGRSHTLRYRRHSVERQMHNGTHERSEYRRSGLCLRRTLRWSHGTLRWDRQYEYSPLGTLLSQRDSQNGQTRCEYDAAGRLVCEHLPAGQVEEYVYDEAGNLCSSPLHSFAEFAACNRLVRADNERFEYDRRGRVITWSRSGGTSHLHYDAADRLVHVVFPDGREWRASYDAMDRRIAKEFDGARTEYYWDGDRLSAEILPSGRLRVFVYADIDALTPLLFVEYESIHAKSASGQVYYLFCDQLGAPILVEDDRGRPVWRAKISAYGYATILHGCNFHMPLRFPGHYFDAELGLHYNRHRYYNPVLGRYLLEDPIGLAGGINLYAYSVDPRSNVDLLGLTCKKPQKKPQKKTTKSPKKKPQIERKPKTKPKIQKPNEKTKDKLSALKKERRKAIDNAPPHKKNEVRWRYYKKKCQLEGRKPKQSKKAYMRSQNARNAGRHNEKVGRSALEKKYKKDGHDYTVDKDNKKRNHSIVDGVVKDKDGKTVGYHEHKHKTGKGKRGSKVVDNTAQLRQQRGVAKKEKVPHIVTISSDNPRHNDGKFNEPRPSRNLEDTSSKVYYVDKNSGEVTHQWNSKSKTWDAVD